jgi:transcriptional regulator NrdR family protein
VAFSKDNGKTFSEKKTIYSGTGIGNSRMMRAKVLSKKDGSFVQFNAEKLKAGILRALEKRAVTTQQVDDLIKSIIAKLQIKSRKKIIFFIKPVTVP